MTPFEDFKIRVKVAIAGNLTVLKKNQNRFNGVLVELDTKDTLKILGVDVESYVVKNKPLISFCEINYTGLKKESALSYITSSLRKHEIFVYTSKTDFLKAVIRL